MLRDALLSAGLFFAAAARYWPALNHEFLFYDDAAYVCQNPLVYQGISGATAVAALTSTEHANWHPLTWWSLQLDYEISGMNPQGYHLTNLLLQPLNSALLCWALRSLTGAAYRSACVAALFALHPLHVESVAWVAERKDVLSGTFWMLTMIAYGCYVRRPGIGRYLALLLSFGLGLAAKSMLVTLPCVLLLLDVWPLRRWRPKMAKRGRQAGNRRGRFIAFRSAKSSSFRGAKSDTARALREAKSDSADDREAGPFAVATPAELFLEKAPMFTLRPRWLVG